MAKILVVDDNSSNRKLVVSLLGDEGHRMLEANDGADGLEAARGVFARDGFAGSRISDIVLDAGVS